MKSYKEIFNSPRNFNSDKWGHYFDMYNHLLGKFYESKVNYLEIKDRYKLPRNVKPSIHETPDIVRDIFSIEFFDSIIAIKKRTKTEPLRIRK